MEKLYVLAGKARSGKDTMALFMENCLKEKGKKVIRLSYGIYPKYYAKLICNWDGKDETKPRSFLQKISVESRDINKGYVTRRMEEDINILKDYFDVIIITDSRLKEEVEMPKEKFKNVITIKVTRPNFKSPLTKKQQENIIETALDNYNNYDYIMENSGTLEEFKEKIKGIL